MLLTIILNAKKDDENDEMFILFPTCTNFIITIRPSVCDTYKVLNTVCLLFLNWSSDETEEGCKYD